MRVNIVITNEILKAFEVENCPMWWGFWNPAGDECDIGRITHDGIQWQGTSDWMAWLKLMKLNPHLEKYDLGSSETHARLCLVYIESRPRGQRGRSYPRGHYHVWNFKELETAKTRYYQERCGIDLTRSPCDYIGKLKFQGQYNRNMPVFCPHYHECKTSKLPICQPPERLQEIVKEMNRRMSHPNEPEVKEL